MLIEATLKSWERNHTNAKQRNAGPCPPQVPRTRYHAPGTFFANLNAIKGGGGWVELVLLVEKRQWRTHKKTQAVVVMMQGGRRQRTVVQSGELVSISDEPQHSVTTHLETRHHHIILCGDDGSMKNARRWVVLSIYYLDICEQHLMMDKRESIHDMNGCFHDQWVQKSMHRGTQK